MIPYFESICWNIAYPKINRKYIQAHRTCVSLKWGRVWKGGKVCVFGGGMTDERAEQPREVGVVWERIAPPTQGSFCIWGFKVSDAIIRVDLLEYCLTKN